MSFQDDPTPYRDGPQNPLPFALPTLTPVVKRLMIVNAAVFLVTFLAFLVPADAEGFIIQVLGLDPGVWRDFFPFVPVWQLATYGFLHDMTTLGHLLGNMLLLYFFGTMLEQILGGRRFLTLYLCAAVVGGSFHLAFELATGASHPAIGASGAALGVVVATACLRPDTRVILIFIPITLKWLAIGIVTMDVFNMLVSFKVGGSQTAYLVHLGGVLYGFLAVKRGWIWADPVQRIEARRAIAANEKRQGEDARMDQLLDKIHREGLNSLSRSEKEFLKRMSSRR